jgi:hypothetical protein
MKNKTKVKKTRGGVVADIARLDFHDFWGRLIDRIKGKTTEKDKGLLMVEKIQQNFGISGKDKDAFRAKMIEMQEKAFKPTKYPKIKKQEPIKWTRDAQGKIISPFDKKKDL